MKSTDRMVLVVARASADLAQLAGDGSRMKVPCGSIGPIIAKKVLDGGGQAQVRAADIKMSIDNEEGLHAVLDNFDLFDGRTREPLLNFLLKKF